LDIPVATFLMTIQKQISRIIYGVEVIDLVLQCLGYKEEDIPIIPIPKIIGHFAMWIIPGISPGQSITAEAGKIRGGPT